MNLIHNNKKVIALLANDVQYATLQVVFNGTQAECNAEIERLQLAPLPPPPTYPTRPPKRNVNVQPT
jgi:hypothetical protein